MSGGGILMLGSNMDHVIHVDQMPRVGETRLGTDLSLISGGKGVNQAAACARLGAGHIACGFYPQ